MIAIAAALTALLFSCLCCCSGSTPPEIDRAPTRTPTAVRPSTTTPSPTPGSGLLQPGPIDVGETVRGNLVSPTAVDVWTLELPEATALTIDLIAVDRWDPQLEVRGDAGERIAFDDDGGDGLNSRIASLSLASGSYEIWVQAYSGSGEYTLSVEGSEALEDQPIEYGQTVQGELTELVQRETWWFEGQAGDMVSISMVGLGGLTDTYLELYGPDGAFLEEDDDSGEGYYALITAYALPESGRYRIVARPYGSQTGRYELTLQRAEIEEYDIVYGQTLAGELEEQGDQEYWFFEGDAGDTVNILMIGLGDLTDTYLELYDASDVLLIHDDDSGGDLSAMIDHFLLPDSGTYRIVARAYGNQVGEYELSLARIKDRVIAYGQTLPGELSGIREDWTFEGAAGDLVSISMVGLGDFQDTVLELVDPDGTLLASDDDSGKGLFALIDGYALPYSGTYRIVAGMAQYQDPYSGAMVGSGGAYRLTLQRIEERAIVYGQTLPGELAEETPRGYWRFEGTAGEMVSISMVGQGGLNDTYLVLYSPDEALLIEDDDSGVGYNALISRFLLPATGTYHILAQAFGDEGGAYQLNLRRETVQERAIVYGETLPGQLTLETRREFWAFNGVAGDVVTISMVGVEGFEDTFLALYDPDGVLLVEDDDSGGDYAARISSFELPADGAYRIVAQAYGGAFGGYELTLEVEE